MPQPDHVVIVIEENKSFDAIFGSASAPYINSLAQQGALFISSHAIGHPSQPNYLALFSGSVHDIDDDSCPHTLTGANLANALSDAGLTFKGYSESMPADGYQGCTTSLYARKHNPWVNFPSVPDAANLTFASFPTDFAELPTVSIVVPNLISDMHDGPIPQGDAWLHHHLDGYIQWAKTHHSLFILTFDEGTYDADNRIVTLLVGESVVPGQYCEPISHYTVLRTLLTMYGLAPFESAIDAAPITSPWTPESAPSPVTVKFTSPSPGARVLQPASLHLAVDASSSNGPIAAVEFFQGSRSLGVVVTAPYELTLTDLAAGDYCFVAEATDALGMQKTSRSLWVHVLESYHTVQGLYQGLIYDTNAVSPDNSGFMTLSLNNRGGFTSRLRVGTQSYRVSGTVNGLGHAQGSARLPLPSPADPGVVTRSLDFVFDVDLTNGTEQIRGALSHVNRDATGGVIGQTMVASVFADRATFDRRTNAAPQAGRYTIRFAGDAIGSSSPGGDGLGAVTVDGAGQARLTGVLADGTSVTSAAGLSPDGRWPLYLPLQRGTGMLLAWVTFSNAGPSMEFSGCARWFKPALASARYYPAGFTNTTCVAGGTYRVPARGEPALTFTNGVAVFTGGNVAAPFTNTFQLQVNGAVLNTGPTPFTLRIARNTGLWQGKVTEPGTGNVFALRGAILQPEESGSGFLLGTTRSGLVRISARAE